MKIKKMNLNEIEKILLDHNEYKEGLTMDIVESILYSLADMNYHIPDPDEENKNFSELDNLLCDYYFDWGTFDNIVDHHIEEVDKSHIKEKFVFKIKDDNNTFYIQRVQLVKKFLNTKYNGNSSFKLVRPYKKTITKFL